MDEIVIEGISLMENLKNHNIVIFRQFQFEHHYIEATGETIILRL